MWELARIKTIMADIWVTHIQKTGAGKLGLTALVHLQDKSCVSGAAHFLHCIC